LSRLEHPNIIAVRLFFVDKGAAYVEFPLYACDMEAWLEQEALTGFPRLFYGVLGFSRLYWVY
jgi:hypothetical protein